MTRALLTIACVMGLGCSGDGPADPGDPVLPTGDVQLTLELVANGLAGPVAIVQPPGESRLFVAEQEGLVRIVDDGILALAPFLDVTNLISTGGERGLLGLAFHPQYATNGRFFVFYTDPAGDARVVRFTRASQDAADPGSAVELITVDQPFANHNGGHLVFGPDGMLYIGLGDGGSGGDPQGHGQNLSTLLGSILRIDVDNPDVGMAYGIPADNPFVNDPQARDEIWTYGLRNPWRFSFDDIDDLLYVADVGQSSFEEITVVPTGTGGLNFGWNTMEGQTCFGAAGCDQSGLRLPDVVYPTTGANCSVTGGAVYQGSIAALRGHYFYSDFCGGFVRSFRYANGEVTDEVDWEMNAGNVTSFGRDAAGELFLISIDGRVLRLVRVEAP